MRKSVDPRQVTSSGEHMVTGIDKTKMPNPLAPILRRIAYVDILGRGWYSPWVRPIIGHMKLQDYDLENVGEFTKAAFRDWLGSHAGDFSRIVDFCVWVGKESLDWETEENAQVFYDAMYGSEE